MIREEEIDKAAKKFAFSDKTETPDFHDVINDFYYGAKWADKTMIEKACRWLKDNVNDYLDWYDWEECRVNTDNLLYDFRKAMEE